MRSKQGTEYCKIILLLIGCYLLSVNAITLQDPARFLKKKLDSKLDTNPYFLTILERKEYNQNYTCSYEEGPYCSLLSNQTIEKVKDTIYTDNMRSYLKEKMLDYNKQIEGHLKTQNFFLPQYYYLDKQRVILDDEIFYKPVEMKYPFRLLIDFNALESHEEHQKSELSFLVIVNLNKGDSQIVHSITENKEYLVLKFTHFFYQIPNKQPVQKQTNFIDRIDELNALPSNVYLLTKEKEGKIEFNFRVVIKQFYAKQSVISFEKVQDYYVKGYDEQLKEIFHEKIKSLNNNNQFQLIQMKKDYTVKYLLFSPQIFIDNIVVHIDRKYVYGQPKFYHIEHNSPSTIEIQQMIKSFDYNPLVITSQQPHESTSQRQSSDKPQSNNQLKSRKIRLTKEERKKQQKIVIKQEQQRTELFEDMKKEIVGSHFDEKKGSHFDEKKIREDLENINKKLPESQKKQVEEILKKIPQQSQSSSNTDQTASQKSQQSQSTASKQSASQSAASQSSASQQSASQQTAAKQSNKNDQINNKDNQSQNNKSGSDESGSLKIEKWLKQKDK